jgi:iron(III) transport system ATP-binding protein
MGYCFRTFQFAGNIGFGVEARSAQRSKRVAVLMEMVALDPARLALAGRIVRRTAAARSFGPSAVSASIMLLDEPFSALDTGLRAATREAIGDLLTHVGATTILVTRDQVEALSFADQIAVIRRGRLVQVGAGTELYLRPKNDLTACFLGEALLPAQLAGGWRIASWDASLSTMSPMKDTPASCCGPSKCKSMRPVLAIATARDGK